MKKLVGKGWCGESGIGSGFTGGDHLAYNVLVPGSLLGVFLGNTILQQCFRDPGYGLLCWGPVMVLGTAAFLMRRRHRKVFILLSILTLLAGVAAFVAAFDFTAPV